MENVLHNLDHLEDIILGEYVDIPRLIFCHDRRNFLGDVFIELADR